MSSFADTRSDAALLDAHARGDTRAFTELYQRHRAQLYRLARRQSRCGEDADDAVQEAMLAMHRYAGRFRRDAAVSSWLHRIVIHACRTQRRESGWPEAEIVDARGGAFVPDRCAEVDTALVVRRALVRLPLEQRAVVLAVDMHDYSIADAARLLNIAEGTVKSRRARARVRLARLLRSA